MVSLLLSDTYKQTHDRMYPKGLERLTSYWTPRKSMLKHTDTMVFFGLQAFIQKYLIEQFDEYFFKLPLVDVLNEYQKYMNIQIGENNYDIDKIENLHTLGYLPLQIKAIPEGSIVDMGVPCIEITNTHDGFAWLVQWIECILQTELWKMSNHATIGNMYGELARHFYDETVDNDIDPMNAFADFGMRGMSCVEESIKCSAAWLLSANKTSTIPALPYIDKYYDADCTNNNIGASAVSTEHSVMGANYSIDGDEITFVKKLLTELYPNTSFSMVSDTYDYWNMVNNIIPACKEEIMNHNGKLLIRPDSGDMVDISIKTIQKLWDVFGGTVNSKGYRVLDPHIGIIYGDGCAIEKLREIWEELMFQGFAANNIVFGVGAFNFTAFREDNGFIVNTRDTFGVAMKATHGVIDGKEIFIYKDPKTDDASLKKSHKGIVHVYYDNKEHKFHYEDELTIEEVNIKDNSAFKEVFCNGRFTYRENFIGVRKRLQESNGKRNN